MIERPKIQLLVIFLFCLFLYLQPPNTFGFQTSKTDLTQLRKLLNEAIKEDFEIVKDIDPPNEEAYWLVHLKPKRTGHFALKYSFKYTHKFSHPEEGENELFIRVGAKNCSRNNQENHGIGNVCLGDTIIVPILISQATGHQFSLKSTYQDGESIGQVQKYLPPSFTFIEQVVNPLENHLKYLGTQRYVMPHRGVGAETVTYNAFFEAKNVGRFNLALTTSLGDEKLNKEIKLNPLDATPIIIVNPGTPITALVYYENTINYSDNKRFSGHAGNNFMTNLLILQPGDVFAIEYARWVEREEPSGKPLIVEKPIKIAEPKLLIHKLPFVVNKEWSYNRWLIDYLPKEHQ